MKKIVGLVDTTARALEERPLSPARYAALFTALVLARHVLEILVAQNPLFTPLQFWVHYPLAYVAPMLALVLVLRAFSGVPVARVTRLMLYVWALTLLPPLVDLLFGHSGKAIGYLKAPHVDPARIFLRFFDPTAQFEGTTAGIRVETALACVLGAFYVAIRLPASVRPVPRGVRMLSAAVGVYVCALGFFTLPRLIESVAAFFVAAPASESLYAEPRWTRAVDPAAVVDRIRIVVLVPLCLALGAVWLARADGSMLRRAVSRLPWAGAWLALAVVGSGLALGVLVREGIAGDLPALAPADAVAAAGLASSAVLAAWAAGLSAPEERPAAVVLALSAVALALGSGAPAAMLVATALALLTFPRAMPLGEPVLSVVGVTSAALAGITLLGAGVAWSMYADALVAIPPRWVAGGLAAFVGAASVAVVGTRPVSAPVRLTVGIAGSAAAALAVPLVSRATAPALTGSAMLGALAAIVFATRPHLRAVWRSALALALTFAFAASLASPAGRDDLIRSVVERPKWVARQAMAYESAGRWDDAVAAYRRAVALDPGFARSWARLGELLWFRAGDLAGSEDALRRAAELDPGAVSVRQQLGMVIARQGRSEEALPWLEEAARLAPGHPVVLRTWARVLATVPGSQEAEAEVWSRYLDASGSWESETAHREEAQRRLRELTGG